MTRTVRPSDRPMTHLTTPPLKLLAVPGAAALLAAALLFVPARSARAESGGSALFSRNCAYCHGSGGKGDGPNAAKLRPRPADLTASSLSKEQIASVVRNGKRACPSWGASLDDDQIAAIAAYVKSLQR